MRTIFICTLPRTGSSLLSADMRSTEALGAPREYFNQNRYDKLIEKWELPRNDLDAYIDALRKRTGSDNGVVAIKLMVRHLTWLRNQGMLTGSQGDLAELSERFGGALVIKLLRRDKLRQAISLVKARQTGKWGVKRAAKGKTKFSDDQLGKAIIDIVRWEALWEREFQSSGIVPAIDLNYEDIPPARDEWLLRIATELGLEDPEGIVANRSREDVELQRQANAETEEWYDRFARNG